MELSTLGLEPYETTAVNVGETYGRLTIRFIGRKPGTYRYIAVCDCACGKTNHLARIDGLKNGAVSSCGCGHRESVTTHGLSKNPLSKKWRSMHSRCYNQNDKRFSDYGGRGIEVCSRWHVVADFVADMEPTYFSGAELDRVDVDGNYEPSNCRWLTHAEQAANKRTTIRLSYNGETHRLVEWAKITGIPIGALRSRVLLGWSAERTLTTSSMTPDERCKLARVARGKPRKSP
jgi:hypothetical protein